LLDKKADINARNEDGSTTLMWAASTGQAETVKYLLEKGADKGIKDKHGDTAYSLALSNGYPEIAALLQ
jgi:hypothetical protein